MNFRKNLLTFGFLWSLAITGCTPKQNGPIEQPKLDAIEVSTLPKTNYTVGEQFTVDGGMLTLTYTLDKPAETIPLTMSMITNVPDMSQSNLNYVVNVSYLEKTTSYRIAINEKVKQTPTIDIGIDNGQEFKQGEDYNILVEVDPYTVEFDVYYYVTTEGESTKTKTKPTAPGDYTILVVTKENSDYKIASASKQFKIVATKVAVNSVQVTIGGKSFTENSNFGNEFKIGTDLTPSFVTDPEGAASHISYYFVVNDATEAVIQPADMVVGTEYALRYEILNSDTYEDYKTHWVVFSLASIEKQEVTINGVTLGGVTYEPSTHSHKIEIGTDLTPTFITTPSEAASEVKYKFIENFGDNKEVEPKDMTTNPNGYAIHYYIENSETYKNTGIKWTAFILTEPVTDKTEAITSIQVKIQDKVFDMATHGEGHDFELGSDITPTFITTPEAAAADIEYKIYNVATEKETALADLVAGVEYSIHINLKSGSKYTYAGPIWVNFKLYNGGVTLTPITSVKVRIQDKVLEMGTYGEGNNLIYGEDLTPTFITDPESASGAIEYQFINNTTELVVEPANMVVGVEYSLHISVKTDSNYTYSGKIWVNFSLVAS